MVRFFFIASLLTVMGCSAGRPVEQSHSKALVDSNAVNNKLMIITGSNDGLPGVAQDPNNIYMALTSAGYRLDPPIVIQGQSAQEIVSATGRVAREMLQISPQGTLIWYFSGHGSESGSLSTASGGDFMFDRVAAEIRRQRGNVALEQLVVILDACFSGQNATGMAAISNQSGSGMNTGGLLGGGLSGLALAEIGTAQVIAPGAVTTSAQYLQNQSSLSIARAANTAGLYKSLVVIASSAPLESSGDSAQGGTGTVAFRDTMIALSQQFRMGKNSTFADLMMGIRQRATGQTPVCRIDPPSMLAEPLFLAPGQASPPNEGTATVPMQNYPDVCAAAPGAAAGVGGIGFLQQLLSGGGGGY